jgi:antitoxin HicB
MFQYSISLLWSDEDEGYIATISEFPNLSAFGETPEQAVKEAQTAADLMVEIMTEDGEEPPPPKKLIQFSGQTRLRLPKTLHRDLVREAEAEGVSLNTLIVTQMAEYLGSIGATRELKVDDQQTAENWVSTTFVQCLSVESQGEPEKASEAWAIANEDIGLSTVIIRTSSRQSGSKDTSRASYH